MMWDILLTINQMHNFNKNFFELIQKGVGCTKQLSVNKGIMNVGTICSRTWILMSRVLKKRQEPMISSAVQT